MINEKVSNEELEAFIAEPVNGMVMMPNRDLAVAMAEELLAFRKATGEPVADVVPWSHPTEERACDIRWRRHDVAPGPLYSVPQIPDEATPDDIEILASIRSPRGVAYQWDEDQRNAAADAWNACRGAMTENHK